MTCKLAVEQKLPCGCVIKYTAQRESDTKGIAWIADEAEKLQFTMRRAILKHRCEDVSETNPNGIHYDL